jgi:hypothetical protein
MSRRVSPLTTKEGRQGQMGSFISGRRLAVRAATAALLAAVAAGGMSVAAGGAYASVNGAAKGKPGPVYGAAPVKPWPASEAAQGTAGAANSSSRASAISATAAAGCGTQLLGNPGFETGSAAPWAVTAGVINPNGAGETSHSGTWYAWLDGYGSNHTDTLSQTVTIPAGCTATTLSFWLHIDTAETTTTTRFDTLKVQVLNSSGTVLATLATFSNLNHATGYQQHSYSLGSFAGQAVTLKFTGTEDASLQTSFVVDDTAVVTS